MSDVSRDRFRSEPLPADWELVRAARAPRDCFADEIAIDFPSIDKFVERLCDGLASAAATDDHPGRTLTADLLVSPHEALVGALITLEVPIQRTCAACGGRGESWADPCGACLGTGAATVRHRVRVLLPPGVVDGSRLHYRLSSPDAAPILLEVDVTIPRFLPGV